MKTNLMLAFITGIVFVSCGNSVAELDPQVREAVMQAAERDAAKVAAAPQQSMQQQNAVFEIKIRQNEMIDAGLDAEAELYTTTVSHILVDRLQILSECR